MSKGDNNQQLLFIQSMFDGIKQAEPIKISVVEKREKIPYVLEVSNNTNGDFLIYRLKHQGEDGLWSSWNSKEEVEKFFKTASFL